MKTPLGQHYLLNLYGCSSLQLNDEFFLCDLIETAAEVSGATVIKTMSHHFVPQGVTAISLLSESHISVHTWYERGEAAIDIFTCGDCLPKVGCDVILEQLKPKQHELKKVDR